MRRTYTHFKPDDPNAVPRFRMFEADTASGLDYFEWKVAQNMKAIVRLAWPDTIPSADQTLVALNDSTLGWSTPAGSGDITAVFTGSGLSGGGPAGSLTLAVKLKLENATLDFTSDSLHVKALGITAAELAANAVTQPKLVLATGAGDASTLTLHDLISGTPDIGEAIQWDGNNWIPAAVGGSITVREVDGSPSIGSIATIEFLQPDGFTVTDQTGGVARIAFTETGDISGVTAGTGLSGGGASGAVSIAADSTSWLATDYQVSLRQAKSDTNTYDATKTFVLSQGFLTSETGDISGVTAGAGLSGGGTSGAVTLDINPKLAGTGLLVITSDSLHIKSGGVSTTEIADGTITGDDLNASIAGSGLVLTAGSPDILDFAPSELTNITFGNGGAATGSITFDLAAGDPTITFGNAVVNVSSGTLQQGGTAVVLQSRTVGTTSPLAGGGALSGDLTLSITANGINATHIDETVQYNFSHASNQFRAALFHGDSLRFYDNGGIKAEDDTLYFFTAGGDVAFKLLLSDAPSNSDVLKISNDNVASWQPDAGGETNTASNLGGGLANYDSKSGVDLRFNTFAAADFDLAANVITIDDTKWAKDSELHAAVTLGTDADVLLGLSTQQLILDEQNANIVFAGPASGGAADPTFRALVDDDIPNDITITGLSGTNTGDVSLAGTPDYITISGQTITRNPLDIADDLNTFDSAALAGRLTDESGSAGVFARFNLTTPAQGDVIYYNGTNWVNLAPGTSGQVLHTQGAGANPIWDADDGVGGGAPIDATYITQIANGSLTQEQALASLATGIMASTTTTGVVATRVLTGTGGAVQISNGDGSGNPTFTLPAAITVPTSYAIGADPADAGVIRLENAAVIGWESAPAGPDITLTVDANEIMQASGAFNAVTLTEGGNAVYTTADGALADDDLSNNSIDDLSDVVITTAAAAHILVRNAGNTAFENMAMSGDGSISAAGALAVNDDSHAHTTTTISGLDLANDLNTFTSSALFGRLTDETGSASGSPLAVFNQNPTLAGATVSGGNISFSDGSGDSPLAVFTPETATAWNLGATESNGDFNIFSASTASTENVNISNPGAGAATLTVEGAISASNFSGSSSGTNTGDEALSTLSAGLDVSDHAVDLDVTPSSGSATLEQSEDALQVKYDSEAFSEGASGLTIAAGGIDGGAGGDIADGSITADDLANAAVSNAKLANMAQNTIKMRVASGAGVPEDIDISSGLALVTAASGDFVIIEDATDGGLKRVDASDFLGGGGAPTDATYITQTPNGTLSAEQALGTLASGMLASTTTTGVVASRVLTGTAGGVEISNGDGSGNPTFTLPSAVTVPASYAIGSDPADAGVIRLENAAVIAWESAPASTDLTLGVDANEILQSSANFNAPVLTEGTNAVPNATDHLGFFAATTSAQLRGVLSDETGGTGVAVFNSNPTLAGATLSGGNLALSDGAGDSPQATFTPQTGTAWALYVEDTGDDFQIEVNTGSAETLDIVNIGAGTINLNIDGTITASNFSGTSSGTNTGDDDVDDEAIHDNVSGEIAAITAKATPTISDFLLIEDAAASNAKKSITLGAMEAALEGVLDLDELQGNLTGSKVNFADTDANWTATNVQAALEELDDVINGGVPNSATAKVDWSQLANVPAGFADGTDDEGAGGGSWSDLTAPTAAVSMVSDGTSETATFDFQAAFTTGNQFTIKQTTGNPSGGSLFAIQASDADVSPIMLLENTAAVTIPIALQIAATNASGVITTAIDMSDGEIVTALAIGSNDVTVGGATISSAEFAALDDGIALTTETSGSYVASVATTSPLAGGAAGSEGATLTLSISADGINATHIDETVAYAWSGASTVTGSMQFDGDALRILDTGADHYLTITPGTNLSANRVLTITTGDAARNLTFAGDATISGTNSGDQTITLTGNVTGSGTGSFAATIAEDVVTAAMMANGSHGAFTYTTNIAALNAGSVSGGNGGIITDGSITADDLGTNSVGADELQADALLWNEIGDAGADATIALGANETDFTSTIDAAGEAVFTITNTDADAANDNSFIDLRHNDGADANVFYLRLIGDNDGSPITDYSFSQTAFLIGAGITTTFSGSVSASALTEGANAVPNATDHLGFFAATTSAQLFGVLSDETGGTGVVVGNISPTISTSLSQDGDVADAGYLRLQNAAIIGWEAAPAGTDITLTVDASEIMQASGTFNAATLTEATNAVPNATDHLGFFAATTSAQLAGVLSDEEGSGGGFVRATSPTITTPTISGAIAFPDGVRQTFNPDGTNAGINVGSQAGDPSSPSNGDLWYDSSANELTARINGANVALGAGGSSDIVRSWTLENPTGAENFGAITFPFAVTVVEVRAVLVGSATPSVTINFSHGSDRSGSGATNLFSSGQAITSTTTGHTLSSFNDATVAADEWFWFTTSAQSGTVSEIVVSVHFTVD